MLIALDRLATELGEDDFGSDADLQRRMEGFLATVWGQALAEAIFGNSPFLTELWLKHPATVLDFISDGPDAVVARAMEPISPTLAANSDSDIVMATLRRAKQHVALAVALADIAGVWPLERVTRALSDLADASLDVAAKHGLARHLARLGDFPTEAQIEEASRGLIILGMGKLGARELNYSSDIDIIFLYDEDRVIDAVREAAGKLPLQEVYVRLTRDVVRLLSERTQDGAVFRTDLRLRPDPASTPAALSVLAAEAYYESVGQNWERAAMVKARAVAADTVAGYDFLNNLRPFIWRKHLDFAAIADIHSIKRQLDRRIGAPRPDLIGYDVKLGRGGIREIEFFAQVQQLIWGGRDPSLRISATCPALDALVAAGRVEPVTAEDLKAAYRFLRRVEHRLQMVEDQQTHTLPDDPDALNHIALFLGYDDVEELRREFNRVTDLVGNHYASLFGEAPSLSGPGSLVFTGVEDDPETLKTLAKLGYVDGSGVSSTIRGWHHGRIRATRSVRARELLTELIPQLLGAFAKTAEPDVTFIRFDRFLANLPSGVQLFSLMVAKPHLLDTIGHVMALAPALADYLGRHPNLLDGVLSDQKSLQLLQRYGLGADIDAQMSDARGLEDVLDAVRRWAGDRRFQAGLRLIGPDPDIRMVAHFLSDVASTALDRLLAAVEAAFVERHGMVPGGRFAVLGFGKFGARELGPRSDLDLVFVYDHPPDVEQSDGEKPLPPSLYYPRLGQRLISALTALTAEGELYQVDMRLRPFGEKGPLASTLASFVAYHETEAWTWEHMALTRARPVAGDVSLQAEAKLAIGKLIARPRDAAKLSTDALDMRARIATSHPGQDVFDAKYRPGGMLDIEFAVQALILRHAADHPAIVISNTATALRRLARDGLLDRVDAALMRTQLNRCQMIQALVRLCLGDRPDVAVASAAFRDLLAKAAGAVDFPTLERDITRNGTDIAALSRRLITQAGS